MKGAAQRGLEVKVMGIRDDVMRSELVRTVQEELEKKKGGKRESWISIFSKDSRV